MSIRGEVAGASRVALVNYPDIGNVGDPALWLGTMSLLDRLGVRPSVHVPIGDLTRSMADRLRGADVILINGGGNFGDLWAGQQQTREQVLEVCAHQRIVQLSQSCWFRDESNLERMVSLIDRAADVTMMWRDRRSLEFAESALPGSHMLAPDMAFGLGAASRDITLDILCLIRADQESRYPGFDWSGVGATVTDWTTDPRPEHPDLPATRQRMREMLTEGAPTARVQPLLIEVARRRVGRGFDILGSGRVIVTDRLHGHIMALLLGRPHVILDNTYSKIADFHRTWTEGVGAVVPADNPREALEAAASMVVVR